MSMSGALYSHAKNAEKMASSGMLADQQAARFDANAVEREKIATSAGLDQQKINQNQNQFEQNKAFQEQQNRDSNALAYRNQNIQMRGDTLNKNPLSPSYTGDVNQNPYSSPLGSSGMNSGTSTWDISNTAGPYMSYGIGNNSASSIFDEQQRFADGGPVYGKGPKGVDSVDAKLAPGEYVLPADVVDRAGGVKALDEYVRRMSGKEPGGKKRKDGKIGLRDGGGPYYGIDYATNNEPIGVPTPTVVPDPGPIDLPAPSPEPTPAPPQQVVAQRVEPSPVYDTRRIAEAKETAGRMFDGMRSYPGGNPYDNGQGGRQRDNLIDPQAPARRDFINDRTREFVRTGTLSAPAVAPTGAALAQAVAANAARQQARASTATPVTQAAPAAAGAVSEAYPRRSETPAVPWGERVALEAQQAATGPGIQSNRPIYRQGNSFTDNTANLRESAGDVTFLGGPRIQAEQAAQASNSDQQLANVLRGISSPEARAQVTADWYAREQASKHEIAKAEATGRAYAQNTAAAGNTPEALARAKNLELSNEDLIRAATGDKRTKLNDRLKNRALQLTGDENAALTLAGVLSSDDSMLGADSNKIDEELVKAHIARNAKTQLPFNDEPGLYDLGNLQYQGLNRGVGAWLGQILPDSPDYGAPYWLDSKNRKVSASATPEMLGVLERLRAQQAGR